jgi:hypothetical protein
MQLQIVKNTKKNSLTVYNPNGLFSSVFKIGKVLTSWWSSTIPILFRHMVWGIFLTMQIWFVNFKNLSCGHRGGKKLSKSGNFQTSSVELPIC